MKPEQLRKEYLDEIDKALVRIGSLSSEAINWLIRFAQLDVPSLSVGDFQNLQFELAAFSIFGNYLGKSYVVSEGRGSQAVVDNFRLLRKGEAVTLQGVVKEALGRLVKKVPGKLKISVLALEVGSVGDTGYCVPSTPNAFEFHAALLLGKHAPRIRRCNECGKIYRAMRRRQQFCSTQCQNRSGARRYRQGLRLKNSKRKRPRSQTRAKSRRKEG